MMHDRGGDVHSGFAPVVHSLSRIGLFDVDRPLSEVLPNFEAGRVPTWSDLMLSLVQPLDGMGRSAPACLPAVALSRLTDFARGVLQQAFVKLCVNGWSQSF